MARKKKLKMTKKVFNEKPETLDGMKKLKEGDLVMYKTPNLIDKCTVESIDKKDGTAILSNKVKVSRGILDNGVVIRVGYTMENVTLKVWDEECNVEYEYFKAKYQMKNIFEGLVKESTAVKRKLSREEYIKIANKFTKILNRYGL